MNILITMPLNNSQKKLIEDVSPNENYIYSVKPADSEIEHADIILGNVEPKRLNIAKNLKWIHLNSAGSDAYCEKGILKEGVILTNSTGAYGLTISEHMIGNILMYMRHLHIYNRQQKEHVWGSLGRVRSIYGSVTLCIGLGDIGTEFCRKMHELGSYTIGVKRRPSEKPCGVDELYLSDKIDELIPRADIIALCLPNTKDTTNIINKERLSECKKDAILINVGRGSSVNTDDLIDALKRKAIGCAILDMTEPEPLLKESPLWDMENVILTPHVAGNFYLPETLNRIVRIAASNFKAFLNGEVLTNIVDFSTGYKK